MNAREADLLLGGYATGTLTEAERSALFAAALSDQALFDALADEETLRELLADPAVKAKLLAALETTPKVIPFWRRPTTMTLAASLLVAVGATLMLEQDHPEQRLSKPPAPAPLTEAAPAANAAAPETAKVAPRKESRAKEAQAPAPLAKKLAQPPPAAPAPAMASALAADGISAEASHDSSRNAKSQAPENRREMSLPSQGVAGGAVGAFKTTRPAAPTWAWSQDASGHPRLTVSWGPGGHLYLLERSPEGTRVLAPVSEAEGRSVFAPTGTAPLDLYWLEGSVADPAALPAEGSVAGIRIRIQPLQINSR